MIENLKDTIPLMKSEDYRDRFRAEYHQVRIRCERLERTIDKIYDGTIEYKPNCEVEVYEFQVSVMKRYMEILRLRAEKEGIEL